MARMGMDADAVEGVGRQLKQSASTLSGLVGTIDRTVSSLSGMWDGPDAQRFVSQTWPGLKKVLLEAQSSVDGLGQSALNNASEQRGVSDGVAAGGGAVTSIGTVVGADSVASLSVADVPAGADSGRANELMSAWSGNAIGTGIDVDHAYGNQCVDVVNDYADHLFPGVPHGASVGGGNAQDLYGSASSTYFERIPPGEPPRAGDVVCIGPNVYSSVGHVAVVESVGSNGQLHVIQQNGADPQGMTYRGGISSIEMKALQGYLRPRV